MEATPKNIVDLPENRSARDGSKSCRSGRRLGRPVRVAASIVLLFLVLVTRAFSQPGMEGAFAEIQKKLLALQQENRRLSAVSDSLAKEIQLSKSHEPLNFFERRRLESVLRNAQELGARREDNWRAQAALRGDAARLAAALDEEYATRIDSLLRTADRVAPSRRQELALEAERLRGRRAALQPALTTAPGGAPPAGAITIRPTDLPEEIEAKADLLRDREDQVRHQTQILERRSGQVRQENALRKKMADLMSDVSVFEQRDETAQHTSRSVTSDRTSGAEKGTIDVMFGTPATPDMTAPAEQLLRIDLRALSAEDTDQLLRDLEGQRRILLLRADSLAAQAYKFDREADSLRAILRQKR